MCGRTLADLGADVVKVEPPGGDPGRWEPPFAADQPGVDRSLAWLAGNINKRSIICDLAAPAGRELFRRLSTVADVLVESCAPGCGLDYTELRQANPGLVYTTITPFGWTGPLADLPAGDLEVTASSGSLWLAGEPDSTPVRSTLPQSAAWAGMYAAMGTLMAVLTRDASPGGEGQHVDVSAQASMVTAISHAPIFWDLLGEEQHRSGPFLAGRSVTGAQFRNVWSCRDGYVTFALYGGPAGRDSSRELVAWMDESLPGGAPPALKAVDWEAFDPTCATQAEVDVLEADIAPFIQGLTKDEFFARFVARNMLGYKVSTVEDILSDPQLAARGFWHQVESPWQTGQSLTFPGSFAFFDGRRPAAHRLAPALGQHTAEVLSEWLGVQQ